ncbi:ATP-binding protein, partial [Bacteroides xylanisolvens]
GLGLSICKLIVHKWKGSIWIDPDYTGGARFVFSHPLNLNIEKE